MSSVQDQSKGIDHAHATNRGIIRKTVKPAQSAPSMLNQVMMRNKQNASFLLAFDIYNCLGRMYSKLYDITEKISNS